LNNPLKYTDPSGHSAETNSETSSTTINYSASGVIIITTSFEFSIDVYSNFPNADAAREVAENLDAFKDVGVGGWLALFIVGASMFQPQQKIDTVKVVGSVEITLGGSEKKVSVNVSVGGDVAPNGNVVVNSASIKQFDPNAPNQSSGDSIVPHNYSSSLQSVIRLKQTECLNSNYGRSSFEGYVILPNYLNPLTVDIGFHSTNSSSWLNPSNLHLWIDPNGVHIRANN
jgi:hypothetical protein